MTQPGLTTATQLARRLGRPRQTVRAAAIRLKIGLHPLGMFAFSPSQCRAIEREIGDGPGRKAKRDRRP